MARDGCVLVVDDEFLIADLLTEMLVEMGLTVCGSAATADEAVALASQHLPALVLMDVRLKGQKDGIEAAHDIRRIMPVPIVFITGSREPETVQRIRADSDSAVLFKPVRFDQLRQVVMQAMV